MRISWIKEQVRLLRHSEWQQVLKQWQDILEAKQLTSTQAYHIKRAITFVSNRPHRLDYKTYLHKGYPITTGAIGSAGGHFVKTRMERNAMHWSREEAQKIRTADAVEHKSCQEKPRLAAPRWDSYMENFIIKEQHKLYKKAASSAPICFTLN